MSKPLLLTGTVSLAAARKGPPRASILAYNGGPMRVGGWGQVVVDLAGLSVPAQVPLLADHRAELSGIIGHARPAIAAGRLLAEGTVSESTEAARQVVALAKEGLAWQASVGLDVTASRPIKANTPVVVNSRMISEAAPYTLITASALKEITVTAIGADGDTAVSIAAMRRGKDTSMTFGQWLQDNGWDSETLTEAQKTSLRAAYDAQNASPPITAAEDMRAEAARLAGIRAACVDHPAIEAKAITENWTVADTELHILRARRPTPPAGHRGRVEATENVLQAALALHLGASDVAGRAFDEPTLEAARGLRVRHVMDLVEAGLRANHIEPRGGPNEILRAAWSTNVVGGILSNTGNKILQDAYRQFPSVARQVAKTLTAKDFKQSTGYRLSGDVLLEEVGAAGEIKHGSLSESAFEFRVSTFARMLSLTRQDIINDDLGALAEIPRMIGRGAALKLESVFWNLVLSNSGSFFGIGNANLIDNPLDVAGLSAAVAAMRRQTDSEGEPIAIGPRFLIVPPELESAADELFASVAVAIAGTADKVRPAGNVFRNKYEPLVTPYLSNSAYPNYSTTGWLLFADPADVAAFGIAYLHGVQSPTIESADADFNRLGFQWRGFMDFGVVAIDPKAAVKSTGDAA